MDQFGIQRVRHSQAAAFAKLKAEFSPGAFDESRRWAPGETHMQDRQIRFGSARMTAARRGSARTPLASTTPIGTPIGTEGTES